MRVCEVAIAGGLDTVVRITDESEPVLENLRFNVDANAETLKARVQVERMVWEEVLETEASAQNETVDVLLGSDVIWGERGPIVGQLVRRLVRPGGWLVLTAQVGREGLQDFEDILRSSSGGPRFEIEKCRAVVAEEDIVTYVCKRLTD